MKEEQQAYSTEFSGWNEASKTKARVISEKQFLYYEDLRWSDPFALLFEKAGLGEAPRQGLYSAAVSQPSRR